MSTERGKSLVKALEQVFLRRERERAPVRTSRVVGRNPDGTVRLQRTDGECIARGGVSPVYTGEVVMEPTRTPLSRRGAAGIAGIAESASVATLWVERLDPDRYRPGATYTVTVTGQGFTPATQLDFLIPGTNQVNEGILILVFAFLDTEHLEIQIAVAEDALLYRGGAPIAYDNPGEPL
jgi:hypothetical protein